MCAAESAFCLVMAHETPGERWLAVCLPLAERDLLRPVIDRTLPLAVPLTPSSTSRPGAAAVVITV
jgi:hypothetical protein